MTPNQPRKLTQRDRGAKVRFISSPWAGDRVDWKLGDLGEVVSADGPHTSQAAYIRKEDEFLHTTHRDALFEVLS